MSRRIQNGIAQMAISSQAKVYSLQNPYLKSSHIDSMDSKPLHLGNVCWKNKGQSSAKISIAQARHNFWQCDWQYRHDHNGIFQTPSVFLMNLLCCAGLFNFCQYIVWLCVWELPALSPRNWRAREVGWVTHLDAWWRSISTEFSLKKTPSRTRRRVQKQTKKHSQLAPLCHILAREAWNFRCNSSRTKKESPKRADHSPQKEAVFFMWPTVYTMWQYHPYYYQHHNFQGDVSFLEKNAKTIQCFLEVQVETWTLLFLQLSKMSRFTICLYDVRGSWKISACWHNLPS